jgi:hypothetical protein
MAINRDFARIALSVYRVALYREDMTQEDAMVAAIESYQHQEQREADARAVVDRARFHRTTKARLRLTVDQVLALQRAQR